MPGFPVELLVGESKAGRDRRLGRDTELDW